MLPPALHCSVAECNFFRSLLGNCLLRLQTNRRNFALPKGAKPAKAPYAGTRCHRAARRSSGHRLEATSNLMLQCPSSSELFFDPDPPAARSNLPRFGGARMQILAGVRAPLAHQQAIAAMDSSGNRALASSLEKEHTRRLEFLEGLRRRYEKNRQDKGLFCLCSY
jgi:hypothetical protein